jgi:small multidrug resistance pump
MKWLYLLLAILAEVIATSALKPASGFNKMIPSAIVIVGYGVAFYFLSLTLQSIPVGVAYAIWSGLGIVLISLVGFVIFKQEIDFPTVIGIVLIIVGVAIINLFSKSITH